MLLSKVSIKRPYFTTMLNLLIIIFGLMAYPKLGIQDNPNVDLPFVSVSIEYDGMNPKTSEELLLKPMEDAFKSLPGLKKMNGSAIQNGASVFLAFNLNVDSDKATAEVRDKISGILFPKEAKPPKIKKFDSNSKSIMSLSVSSNKLSFQELSNFIKYDLKPQLQTIEGVGNISVFGDQTREIQINLNPSLINAMKISPTILKSNVTNQIINEPTGTLRETKNSMGISTYNIPDTIDKISKLPIILEKKPLFRLEDIATVKDSVAEAKSYSELNGKKTIALTIIKKSQGNVVNISKEIKTKIEKIKSKNIGVLDITITNDYSDYIIESFHSSIFELVLGSFFAVLIVFLFLHDWRNTLICAVAIPTSLIGTFAVAHALDFTLNSLTLIALTLSVGILVDDAIVVIENIHRHRILGKNPFKAANEGTDEIGLAAIAVTLAVVAVFVPVAFMDGLIGKFFFEFGITVATAVLISLFVAFTIVPMMSSRILKENHQATHKKNKYATIFDTKFEKIQNFYQKTLQKLLKFKKTSVFCGIIIFILSIVLLKFVPIGFYPETDNSTVNFDFTLEKGIPLNLSIERGKELEGFIRSYPGVENVLMTIGSEESSSSSKINYMIMLVKPSKRNFTQTQFTEHLSNDAKKFIRSPKEKIGYGDNDYLPIQVNLISSNSDLMNQYSKKLIEYMNSIPGVKNAKSSIDDPIYELRVVPNNLKAASLGINTKDIANTLKLLYGGVKVGDFYGDGRFYDIKITLPLVNNQTLNDFTGVTITSSNGSSVLLSTVASLEKLPIDPVISHLNGNNMMTISANYSEKDLNGVTKQIEDYVNKTKPFGITNDFSGESKDVQEMIQVISSSLLLAVLFIFMVLCAQFENFTGPFSILLSIPLAFSGSFLALLITQQALTLYSMIGIIMLMGLVTKNAILLIEFAQQKIAEGSNVDNALLEAAIVRFRPIVMTTLTMIAGMMPMVFSSGPGSGERTNIGVTVMGGLISSTLLTLLIVPCAYSILMGFKNKNLFAKFKFKKKVT
jgi:hydrophobic/amphiphilic exporter-1 (mainly G- bacteria), HAE1 family